METIIKGKTKEVIINANGPVVIIGESINPTRRKKLGITLQAHDFSYLLELAKVQIGAGAEVLDVNIGYPGVDDEKLLPEVIKVLLDNFDIPLCLDTPNPKAIASGLKVAPERTMVNSVNGEEKSMQAILPVVKEYNAVVIGLLMDDDGISQDINKRLSVAEKLFNRVVQLGIPMQDLIIDPLAMAICADPMAALVTLGTIEKIKEKYNANMTLGASNVSFGLPDRHSINLAYLTMAIMKGVTCPITNPEKLTSAILATDLLMGRDEFAMKYTSFIQSQESLKTE